MPASLADLSLKPRSPSWRWWVCCLLLMATMINYMDRLTLNLLKVHITADLGLSDSHYGWVEGCFGLAFALGAIVFGFLVDRWNVVWIYPLALVGWSMAGFFTGFAQGFASLLLFRMMLGFMESANWPCALRTTQHILPPHERSMGNSLLQSGAAVGAIIIPLTIMALFDESQPKTWRLPFMVVGTAGITWVLFWCLVVRPADLRITQAPAASSHPVQSEASVLPRHVFRRRFLVLIVLTISINMTWHFLRAWLPSFLMQKHDFRQNQTNWFSFGYYVFTDLGALVCGFATLWLVRRGMRVHASRRLLFLMGSLLTTLCFAVPFVSEGWLLVPMLLLVGFGSLALFPCYYSFSQDLTVRSQGKVTGSLGACCWFGMFLWQIGIGHWVDHTKSYTLPFIIAGLAPLVGFTALALFWGPTDEPAKKPLLSPAGEPSVLPAKSDERIVAVVEAVEVRG